ncbi:MAG TPA: beta-ribofuranosylaminobenzene 5'-phosphate synthase family protein [Burkholderiales bacterium]|nr:beta-ribofuranosylaminobenzene 5'-phosphate synthase family protein [Burkholderiales bacterium]
MRQVSAHAPARLHLGFLDPSGSRGRRFCSVGLTLEGMGVSLTVERAPVFSVSGPQAARVEAFARSMREKFNLPGDCRIVVHQAIPEHVGLGSGTQLAIAVGAALAALYRLDLPPRAIATLYERGQRSGIGVGAFEQGGFLIDGGKDAGADPPPIVSRLEFPAGWRVVLLLDSGVQGLHGESEIAAFQALPEFPESESAHLCRLMFTQALPALVEQDLDKFGRAIGELQRVIGDYFAPAQGGRFSNPRVAEALAWLESKGVAAVGQSSWGPTGFAIVGDEAQALALVRSAQSRWGGAEGLQFTVCSGRNRGGDVELVPLARFSADGK